MLLKIETGLHLYTQQTEDTKETRQERNTENTANVKYNMKTNKVTKK